MTRSSRPVWLGEDRRTFDHVRVHLQVVHDPALTPSKPDPSVQAGPQRGLVLAVYLGVLVHAETGTGDSRPAQSTLARYAGCSTKTVARCLDVLVAAGYIEIEHTLGHASTYRALPPPTLDSRSVVLTSPDRESPSPDSGGAPGVAKVDEPPTPGPTNQQEIELDHELEPSIDASVDRLCDLLADLIEQNGSKRPTISKSWRLECSRMIRLDGRDPVKIERAIRWCQGDTFWRANVLSMPTLRKQYDRLRLAAERERASRGSGGARDERAEAAWDRGGQSGRVRPA